MEAAGRGGPLTAVNGGRVVSFRACAPGPGDLPALTLSGWDLSSETN
jgi:hypothetical protein